MVSMVDKDKRIRFKIGMVQRGTNKFKGFLTSDTYKIDMGGMPGSAAPRSKRLEYDRRIARDTAIARDNALDSLKAKTEKYKKKLKPYGKVIGPFVWGGD